MVVGLAATSCGGGAQGASAVHVAVAGSNTGCAPASADIAAGKTTFDYTNGTDRFAGFYILRSDGSIVKEVEDVARDASVALVADLVAGDYDLMCPVGQQVESAHTTVHVSGTGGKPEPTPDLSVTVTAKEYSFTEPVGLALSKGQTVRFELANDGTVSHEVELHGPDGVKIAKIPPTKPGSTIHATVKLATSGAYTLVCGLRTNGEKHETLGMLATITVA